MTTATNKTDLPAGTKVLNTNDGEPGSVMNGYARGASGEWTEYEIETAHAIEIWKRAEFITMDEANAANA